MYVDNHQQQIPRRGIPRFGLPREVRIGKLEQQVPACPGSVLRAKTQGLWPDHSGILGLPLPDGTWSVVHKTERGTVLTTFEDFAFGRWVEVVDTPTSLEQQRSILERAYSQIGQPYNLLFANCEHFATWAFYGVPESPQLRAYTIGAGLVGMAIYALGHLDEGRGPRRARRRKAQG